MNLIKKVLIAIDYNPCAQKVAETGYVFAEAMNAEISIVHAFSNIEEQNVEANNFLAAVVQHLGDNKIKTGVLDGKTAEVILEYAAEWNADFI